MGPLAGAPRLSGSVRRALRTLGALGVLQAAAVLATAEALAAAIASLAEGRLTGWHGWLVVLVAAVLVRAAVASITQATAVRAAAASRAELRGAALDGLGEQGAGGARALLLTRGLDALDGWFGQYLPALVGAAVLPPLVGVRLLLADPLSALVVALTVPLVPVFMVLIGRFTAEHSAAARDALGRLGDRIVELARGMPVLVGLRRAGDAAAALAATGASHRVRTMRTLRLAFLSALALELIATLSVAVVAVVVGIRLLHGDLDLRTGLLVLVLAPECYLPLRAVGTAYHAAADGVSAFRQVGELLDAPRPRPLTGGPAGAVVVRGLSVRRPGQPRPRPDGLDLRVPERGFVAVTGTSGCGKSTLLDVLTGRLGTGGETTVCGTVSGVDPDRIAVVPQRPTTTEPTVRAELLLAAASLGPVPDGLPATVLSEVDLEGTAERDPAGLSVGEVHRVALARALLRVRLGARLLLLDEPSAHLDAGTEDTIARTLDALRGTVTVVLVSHREAMLRLADEVVGISCPPEPARAPVTPATVPRAPVPAAPTTPATPRLAPAVLLGAGAAVSGLALTATSAWLIVRAAEQPPMLTLLVAIVGVRAFGLARAGLRYAERLAGHDAVLRHTTALRLRLWHALSRGVTPRGPRDALNRVVSDVDEYGELLLRAVHPLAVCALTGAVTTAGLWLVLPTYGPLLACTVLAIAVLVPAIAVHADRRASVVRAGHADRMLARVSAVLGAPELAVHGAAGTLRAEIAGIDRALVTAARRTAFATGLAGALLLTLCVLAAAAGLLLAAEGIADGSLDPVLAGVLALVPLGLADAFAPIVPAAQLLRGYPATRRRIRATCAAPPAPERRTAPPQRITSLRLRGVTARWPSQADPVFRAVDATVHRGEWLAVTGASGSGKSTLLAVLLGFLPPHTGEYRLSGRDTAGMGELTDRISWCPQDAMLFSSTVRGNLALAGGERGDHELRAALHRVGLRKDLDANLGEAGSALSGGEAQRLAVARALLRGAEVVLLDEPTAHLDTASATALLADLRTALAGTIVVLVTHDPTEAARCTQRITLGTKAPTRTGAAQ